MSNEPAASPPETGVADVTGQKADPSDHSPVPRMKNILDSLEDSKAEDIVTIDLEPSAALADAMVIASGRSNRHVAAIAEHLLEDLRKSGFRDYSVEGQANSDWVLVDTGDVIVHIFRPEVRAFYNLEKLWSPHAPKA